MKEIVHCYWAFDKPNLFEGVTTGIAMCGERSVPREQLTCDKAQTTCKSCNEKYPEYSDGLGIPEFLKRRKNDVRLGGGELPAKPIAFKEEKRQRFDKPKSLSDEEYDRLKALLDPESRPAVRAPAAARPATAPAALDGQNTATTDAVAPKQRTPSTSGKGKAFEIVALMRKPGGVTREEVLAAMGWKAVSMQQQAEQAGVVLKVDKSSKPYRYMVE